MKWGTRRAKGSPSRLVFAHAERKRASPARAGAGKCVEDDECPHGRRSSPTSCCFLKNYRSYSLTRPASAFESFSTPVFAALVPTVHSSALQPMEADLVSSLGDLRAAKSHRLTACLPRPAFRCF